jgi:hypothetical protein
MALVLCPECGEETLDQLVSCPLCNVPLAANQQNDRTKNNRLFLFGAAFVGGLVAATVCNMMGHTVMAIGLGIVGVVSIALLLLGLNADS